MKTVVKMPESIINDKNNWMNLGETYYYSHHMYKGTPMEAFETVDTCGNCDGARCDICKKITVPAKWQLSAQSCMLYDALVADGLSEDIASELAYSDFPCKTHKLDWDVEIPEDILKLLTEPDERIFKWLDENYDPEEPSYRLSNKYCESIGDMHYSDRNYVNIQIDLYKKIKSC